MWDGLQRIRLQTNRRIARLATRMSRGSSDDSICITFNSPLAPSEGVISLGRIEIKLVSLELQLILRDWRSHAISWPPRLALRRCVFAGHHCVRSGRTGHCVTPSPSFCGWVLRGIGEFSPLVSVSIWLTQSALWIKHSGLRTKPLFDLPSRRLITTKVIALEDNSPPIFLWTLSEEIIALRQARNRRNCSLWRKMTDDR